MREGVTPAAWAAMVKLRDKIANGEQMGWFAVHNGDMGVAEMERKRMMGEPIEVLDDDDEQLQLKDYGDEQTQEVPERVKVRILSTTYTAYSSCHLPKKRDERKRATMKD